MAHSMEKGAKFVAEHYPANALGPVDRFRAILFRSNAIVVKHVARRNRYSTTLSAPGK